MRARKVPPVPVPVGRKYCFKCKLCRPLSAFAKDAKQWDGKKLDCRDCDNAAWRARHEHRKTASQLA